MKKIIKIAFILHQKKSMHMQFGSNLENIVALDTTAMRSERKLKEEAKKLGQKLGQKQIQESWILLLF